MPIFDNIFRLEAVPVATVQLRFDGWVTEFEQRLTARLRERLTNDVRVFRDVRELQGNHLLTDELRQAVEAGGLSVSDATGVVFNPLTGRWSAARDTAVNYILSTRRT